ncbi:MAG: DNRLRE domain-containing protein [Leadbetterella sp.]
MKKFSTLSAFWILFILADFINFKAYSNLIDPIKNNPIIVKDHNSGIELKFVEDKSGVDCIQFKLSSNKKKYQTGERLKVLIDLNYINQLDPKWKNENCENFSIKLVMPEGFVRTGGTYVDFENISLNEKLGRKSIELEGYFTKQSDANRFILLKGPTGSDLNSVFVKKEELLLLSYGVELDGYVEQDFRDEQAVVGKVACSTPTGNKLSADCSGSKFTMVANGCPSKGIYKWYGSSSGGTVLQSSTSSSFTTPALKVSRSYWVSCTTSSCSESTRKKFDITVNPRPSRPSTKSCLSAGCPNTQITLTATCSKGTTPVWYLNKTSTVGSISVNQIPTSTTKYFVGCKNNSTNCETLPRVDSVVFNLRPYVNRPTSKRSDTTICVGSSVKLSATCVASTPQWFENKTGGKALSSTTVLPSTTKKYFVGCLAIGNTKCTNPTRSDSVVITVNSNGVRPTNIEAYVNVCLGSSHILEGKCTGSNIVWYTSKVGGAPLLTNVVSPTSDTKYYATCGYGTSSCASSVRLDSTIVYVSKEQSRPSGLENIVNISRGSSHRLLGTCIGSSIKWYTTKIGGIPVSGDIVTPTTPTTYYAECVLGSRDCGVKARLDSTIVNIVDTVSSPTILLPNNRPDTTLCFSEQVVIKSRGCLGVTTWSSGQSGDSIRVGAGTYTATCTYNGVTSAPSTSIRVYSASPATPIITGGSFLCLNTSLVLKVSNCGGRVEWMLGSSVIGQDSSLVVTQMGNYRAVCKIGLCSSISNEYPVNKSQVKPNIEVLGDNNNRVICSGAVSYLYAGIDNTANCTGTNLVWSDGVTGRERTVSVQGVYKAKCTHAGTSCPDAYSEEVTITVLPKPEVPNITKSLVSTAGSQLNSLNLTASNCSGTVKWSNGGTGASTNVSPNDSTNRTLYIKNESINGKDATIRNLGHISGQGLNDNLGNDFDLNSNSWTWSGSPGNHRNFIDFNLRSIPSSSAITSSSIKLYNSGTSFNHKSMLNQSSNPNSLNINRVTSAWQEGTVTWNNQPSISTQNVVTSGHITYAEASRSIQISNLVSDYVKNPSVSYGFSMINTREMNESRYYNGKVFASSDYLDSKLHPELVVSYIGKVQLPAVYTAYCQSTCGYSSSNITIADSMLNSTVSSPTILLPNNRPDTTLCFSEQVVIKSRGCLGVTTWSSGQSGDSIRVGAGIYTATCTYNGVTSVPSTSIRVYSASPATPIITGGSFLCLNTSLVLKASNCNGSVSWLLNSSVVGQDSTLTVNQYGTYEAVCSIGSCSSVSESHVVNESQVKPNIEVLGDNNNRVICSGAVSYLYSTLNEDTPNCTGTNLVWNDGVTGNERSVSTQGVYKAKCTHEGSSCPDAYSEEVTITVLPKPEVPNITKSLVSTAGSQLNSLNLTASNCSGTVKWSNGDTGTSTNVSPNDSTNRTLFIKNESINGKDANVRRLTHWVGEGVNDNLGNHIDLNSNSWTWSGSPGNHRNFIDFNLRSIPSSSTINSSSIKLYNSGSSFWHKEMFNNSSNPNTLDISRVISAWEEGTVTWANQPSVSTQSVSTSNHMTYTEASRSVDIKNVVTDYVRNPSGSYGFAMINTQEMGSTFYYNGKVFASSDYLDSKLHPELVVSYTGKVQLPAVYTVYCQSTCGYSSSNITITETTLSNGN